MRLGFSRSQPKSGTMERLKPWTLAIQFRRNSTGKTYGLWRNRIWKKCSQNFPTRASESILAILALATKRCSRNWSGKSNLLHWLCVSIFKSNQAIESFCSAIIIRCISSDFLHHSPWPQHRFNSPITCCMFSNKTCACIVRNWPSYMTNFWKPLAHYFTNFPSHSSVWLASLGHVSIEGILEENLANFKHGKLAEISGLNDDDHPGFYIYSGGTTGRPKCIEYSLRAARRFGRFTAGSYPVQSTMLFTGKEFHSGPTINLLSNLSNPTSFWITPGQPSDDLPKYIDAVQPTVLALNPGELVEFCALTKRNTEIPSFPCVKMCFVFGSTIPHTSGAADETAGAGSTDCQWLGMLRVGRRHGALGLRQTELRGEAVFRGELRGYHYAENPSNWVKVLGNLSTMKQKILKSEQNYAFESHYRDEGAPAITGGAPTPPASGD